MVDLEGSGGVEGRTAALVLPGAEEGLLGSGWVRFPGADPREDAWRQQWAPLEGRLSFLNYLREGETFELNPLEV